MFEDYINRLKKLDVPINIHVCLEQIDDNRSIWIYIRRRRVEFYIKYYDVIFDILKDNILDIEDMLGIQGIDEHLRILIMDKFEYILDQIIKELQSEKRLIENRMKLLNYINQSLNKVNEEYEKSINIS